ncbi:hypothetical protein MXB_3035 [Myxobolus squamalis]|nr:hypothetical protein MXB_3035 [Myxobolus squamalis]
MTLNGFRQLRIELPYINQEWLDHKSRYGLKFSEDEDNHRKSLFEKNLRFIINTNAQNKNLTLKMNKFGHLEKQEMPGFINLQSELKLDENEEEPPIFVGREIPLDFDWTKYDVLSPVEDQLYCGSCYAFSAIGAIESQFAIQTGILPSLSKQEIIDCSKNYGNYACLGGYEESVYRYCMDHGLSNSSDYPYYAAENQCSRENHNNSYKLQGYKGLTKGDEANLLRAIYYVGPISIAFDSGHDEFNFYTSGIINIPSCTTYNRRHAVLAVGYNLTETPYLLVKNSFGTEWGIDGYFKISLFNHNMCGIASWGHYPIVMI